MHPNAALVHRFYTAFDAHDAEAMAECYHKDVVFSDPVFGELRGERAADMWRMLVARADELSVRVADVAADDLIGSARWVAQYRFGKARRPVRNVVEARFEFKEGKIARHDDAFDLWAWTRMALGPTGWLLGWTPMVQGKVRAQARAQLDRSVASR